MKLKNNFLRNLWLVGAGLSVAVGVFCYWTDSCRVHPKLPSKAASQAAQSYSSTKFPTFKSWQTAMQQLPTYYSLAAKGVLNSVYNTASNYQYSAFAKNPSAVISATNPCDFSELLQVIQAYFELERTGTLAQAVNWVNQQVPPASFFDPTKAYFTLTPPAGTTIILPTPAVQPNSAPFTPFVQKLNLPAGAQVILRGDLHGDGISLFNQLVNLQQQGYLNLTDGFKLTSPSFYMLFLGDYTDRGLYGAEVIYMILRLKLANPNQVFMVRGNHEDIDTIVTDGFMVELNAKFGNLDFSSIYRLYEFLPAALYLGCGNNYWQCCHGGLEIGYDPSALLNTPASLQYQLLGELKQVDFLQAHNDTIGQYFLQVDSCDCPEGESCETCTHRAFYPTIFANFTPTTPLGITGQVLGFMWNEFAVYQNPSYQGTAPDGTVLTGTYGAMQAMVTQAKSSDKTVSNPAKKTLKSWELSLKSLDNIYGSGEICLARLINGRMYCSQGLTQAVLAAQSQGQSYTIRGVLRAHQHEYTKGFLMMDGVVQNNGVFGIWPATNNTPDQATSTTRKLADYTVLTFCVAPDNIFGVGCQFNWDTFGILSLDPDVTKCELQIRHTTVSKIAPVVPKNPAKLKAKLK